VGEGGFSPLVIFDCDGVLVDSERISVRVGAAILAEHGWHLTEQDFAARFVGCSAEHFDEEISGRLGLHVAREWDRRHADRYRQAFEAELQAVPGVVDLLTALAVRGTLTCVASNSDRRHVEHVLAVAGVLDRFEERIFSAQDVAAGKPAPDLFLHAARAFGADPADCIVIEDSPFGVMAAQAAGMRCYGYAGGLTPAHRLSDAGAVTFDHMAELIDVLAPDERQDAR
jgi:HAD superfamily hydrolase (TIGR01509 family)